MIRVFSLIALLSITILACKKKEVGPQCPSCIADIQSTTSDVLIGCEGNFGWGNASITQYKPTNGSVTQQVFYNVNGYNPGDVLQSFYLHQSKLYIVLNNSGKIEIIDTTDYTSEGAITGLTSPRYMVAKFNTAYCSDLYSDEISIINLTNHTVSSSISCGRWTEHLLIQDDKLYATCPDTNWVLGIDLTTNLITDTLIVGKAPSGIQVDYNDNIWVLCSGGNQAENASIWKINNNIPSKSYNFSSTTSNPSQLTINAKQNKLYFLDGDVFTYDVDLGSISSGPIIQSGSAIFYGLGVDPNNSDIYVSDAIDYVQPGKVYRYDSLYIPIDTITTGIIPQAFWFK